MSKVNFGPYSIRNLKTFKGMEEMGGFNLTLCKNGNKIGEVINDDSGGPNMYHLDKGEFEALQAYAKTQHPTTKFEVEDQFIEDLLDAHDQQKRMKRWCKTKTIFRLQGDKEGTFRTISAPYNDPRIQPVLKKQGTIIELYNEKGERVI